MIYSVWNAGAKRFDYYKTSEPTPTHAPPPRHVPSAGLGATPDEAAWPLPTGAQRIGAGQVAQGRIASTSSGGSSRAIMVAAGALLVFLLGRKVLR